MANLVGRIKDSLPDGCIALGRLRKEGCSVSLKNAPTPSVTIDMDKRKHQLGGTKQNATIFSSEVVTMFISCH